MKFTIATIALLASFAVAMPAQQLNAQQDAADAKAANVKAASGVNVAANDGSTGVTAADKAEAATLLADNGDVGAAASGADFDDAVKKIQASGNKDEIAVLTAAGAINATASAGAAAAGNAAGGKAAAGNAAAGKAAAGKAAGGKAAAAKGN